MPMSAPRIAAGDLGIAGYWLIADILIYEFAAPIDVPK
jgi:hypothetical protein